jgi:hypothetical protein
MKEYGPVIAGGPAGDFGVTHLTRTAGWVVSGHYFGMYTYVNPAELKGIVLEREEDNCTAVRNLLCTSFRTSRTVKKDFEGQSVVKKE